MKLSNLKNIATALAKTIRIEEKKQLKKRKLQEQRGGGDLQSTLDMLGANNFTPQSRPSSRPQAHLNAGCGSGGCCDWFIREKVLGVSIDINWEACCDSAYWPC